MIQYLKNVSTLEYKVDNCTGCKRCIEVCPREVFKMEGYKAAIIDKNRCMECGACMMNCASDALTVDKGVGCAAAVLNGFLNKSEPSCDCGSEKNQSSDSNCCC